MTRIAVSVEVPRRADLVWQKGFYLPKHGSYLITATFQLFPLVFLIDSVAVKSAEAVSVKPSYKVGQVAHIQLR